MFRLSARLAPHQHLKPIYPLYSTSVMYCVHLGVHWLTGWPGFGFLFQRSLPARLAALHTHSDWTECSFDACLILVLILLSSLLSSSLLALCS